MIILLRTTQLPENLGAVARVMGNFGLNELRLIAPRVDPHDSRALATAAGAEVILRSAKIYDSVADATADVHHLLGTCGDHNRQGIRQHMIPNKAFEKSFPEAVSMGILFGCERTGLSQDDLSHCKAVIRVPVNPAFSSMNLSHSVAIVIYEWFKAAQQPSQTFMHWGDTKPATQMQKESLFANLLAKLDAVDYWRVPAKKPLMQQNLANLFFRMNLSTQEVQTLFGVFDALYRPRR
mgnify:CR=1 FL=1